MNQKLHMLHDAIHASDRLTENEKNNIAALVAEVDRELTIIEFKLERTDKVKRTTGILLEETIEELEQKRRAVEGQRRALEIEASLERVRARAMAMHSSAELGEAAVLLYQELRSMGITRVFNCGYVLIDEDANTQHAWMTHADGSIRESHQMPLTGDAIMNERYERWKRKDPVISQHVGGTALKDHLTFVAGQTDPNPGVAHVLPQMPDPTVFYCGTFSEGYLHLLAYEELSKESEQILSRFTSVFEITYRRFRDLQKAESQAREAQIEASLERVRARSVAMRTSDELVDASDVLFSELKKLGIHPIRTGVATIDGANETVEIWSRSEFRGRTENRILGVVSRHVHPFFDGMFQAWREHQEFFAYDLVGEEVRRYYEAMAAIISYPERLEYNRRESFNTFFFPEGSLNVISHEPLGVEECALMVRFARVFGQTYRRFLDLRKAEALARESQIEASLERVRSRTLAMQKSDELAETAAVLFQQLIALGIAPNRLYIAIIKDGRGNAEFWITDEDGSKVSSGFAANLHENRSFQKMFEGLQAGEASMTIDMQGGELQEYFEHLNSLHVPFKDGLSQKRRVQTIAYFSRGFLGMASPDEQSEETTALLERFAAVFNLTMTRFNDLQLAEAQAHQAHLDLIQLQTEKKRAEDALSELRATQEQLVQQEKLASLGQLTAGIAHEIKNPLNFVNNFSAVSVELVEEAIEEMKHSAPELQTGEMGQLLADVKSNLTKIVEHGTRADSIVKSMLHHSRGGSGRMEPTDLNALLKEYVNLAFHGMRAGKNPITVTIDLDLAECVGKASLVAEDFSRVIVNICQNAFDAMREKVNSAGTGQPPGSYLPKLTVRSRRDTERITVEIEDNGPGIPDAIRDKIMQPFFTTKRGTQGTGLGLSISHDIVKANRGELKIGTNGSGGATFAIGLPVEPRK